jgi:hypothetical protein
MYFRKVLKGKRKTLFVGILMVPDKKNRIRIRKSVVQIRIRNTSYRYSTAPVNLLVHLSEFGVQTIDLCLASLGQTGNIVQLQPVST